MKPITITAIMAALIAAPALAGEAKEICPEDCPAYVEHPDKANLNLEDVHALCALSERRFIRLVKECIKKSKSE